VAINMKHSILGAILGQACGDALGGPTEFLKQSEVKAKYGRLTEMVGGGRFKWLPGEWTDDTAMMLAVAEGILTNREEPVEAIGEGFIRWSKDAKDIGGTIAGVLYELPEAPTEDDWFETSASSKAVFNNRAAGTGALMRTLPVALAYANRNDQLAYATIIGCMTHWDSMSVACCCVYVRWVDAILRGYNGQEGPITEDSVIGADPDVKAAWEAAVHDVAGDAGKVIVDAFPPLPDPEWDGWLRLQVAHYLEEDEVQPSGFAGFCLECLEAAVWAVCSSTTAEEVCIKCANLGGESDTIGAVAGGAAGAAWPRTLPARWLNGLYQRERLVQVAAALFQERG
jgi:ADP-ribosyl-[dinitrogen reductase] hydrolase